MIAHLTQNIACKNFKQEDFVFFTLQNSKKNAFVNNEKIELFYNEIPLGYVIFNINQYPFKKKHVIFYEESKQLATHEMKHESHTEPKSPILKRARIFKTDCNVIEKNVENLNKVELEELEKQLFNKWKKIHIMLLNM